MYVKLFSPWIGKRQNKLHFSSLVKNSNKCIQLKLFEYYFKPFLISFQIRIL